MTLLPVINLLRLKLQFQHTIMLHEGAERMSEECYHGKCKVNDSSESNLHRSHELPEPTRTALFNNYLVNLLGKEGGFIELNAGILQGYRYTMRVWQQKH